MTSTWVLALLLCASSVKAEVDVPVHDFYHGSFHGDACDKITKPLSGWTAHLVFDQDIHFIDVSNAKSAKINEREFTLSNLADNADLKVGDDLCILFTASTDADTIPHASLYIEGMDEPDTLTKSRKKRAASENIVPVQIGKQWNGGFQGKPCIDIVTDIKSWTAHLTFGGSVDKLEAWVAIPVRMGPSYYQLKDKYNSQLHAGDKLCFEFVAKCACSKPLSMSIYIEGNTAGAPSKDYSKALRLSILFYAAQRSGKMPPNNPVRWRGDSAMGDCVKGGWYDAGDHVKFGLPMASSTSLLAWGLVQFKDGYQQAGQLNNMYDSLKVPLDYFLTAWDQDKKKLLVQIGDGKKDHAYWGRAEDMRMARPCQYVSSSNKGSDIAAETAAAMAAGAVAFKSRDQSYFNALVYEAKSLYKFAKNNRGVFQGAKPFYSTGNDADELCEAAIWLYKATRDSKYLKDAENFVNTDTPWALFWANKFLACQTLLYQETKKNKYKQAVTNFFWTWSREGNFKYTPCGLAWRGKWGANRHAGNSALVALIAADLGIKPGQYRKWAVEQVNYLLGDNRVRGKCFSFMVGYGQNYPQQPHHRGASCPDSPTACSKRYLDTTNPNPHVLYGALVGGPDENDQFPDKRSNYITNEVATDYNAGFQGALAGIVELTRSGTFPKTNEPCPCGR